MSEEVCGVVGRMRAFPPSHYLSGGRTLDSHAATHMIPGYTTYYDLL